MDPPRDPAYGFYVREPAAQWGADCAPALRAARPRPDLQRVSWADRSARAAFENYDALGQWRDTENGEPIDASGDLVGTDLAGAVDGPVELVRRIAQSEDARRCYANQWMSYAYGRGFSAEDACTRERVEAAFLQADGGIHELLLALTQTDAFLYRSIEPP